MTALESAHRCGLQAMLAASGSLYTRTPAGTPDAAVTVRGDFLEKYERIDPVSLQVDTSRPALYVDEDTGSDPEHAQGDYWAVNGVTYYVQEIQSDGVGGTWLILSRDTQAPKAPSGLHVELVLGQAVLSWTRNATNNAAVEVFYTSDGSTWSRFTPLAAGVVTYTDSSGSVALGYKVRNTNSAGPSPFTHIFNTDLWALTDESGNIISDENSNVIVAPA